LVRYGFEIECFRQQYIEVLEPLFIKEIARFFGERGVTIDYRASCDSEDEFQNRLEQTREEEIKRGYTLTGPHRSDLLIRLDGRRAGETASRGEQKLIIAALFLAQARLVGERGEEPPVFLVDDLPAELDGEKRAAFLDALKELGIQVFITSTEAAPFQGLGGQKMFHVEQGMVTEWQ
jgi:DNA replication and repair protein RecF